MGEIWNEKIHLLKLAKDLNPTDFYIWVDSGISSYRDIKPPSTRLNIKNTYPTDKLCHSSVDGDYHNFSGGVLLIHFNFIDTFHKIYYNYLKKCNRKDKWQCGSDQVIFTDIKDDYPELFHKMSTGYGKNLNLLYDELN